MTKKTKKEKYHSSSTQPIPSFEIGFFKQYILLVISLTITLWKLVYDPVVRIKTNDVSELAYYTYKRARKSGTIPLCYIVYYYFSLFV